MKPLQVKPKVSFTKSIVFKTSSLLAVGLFVIIGLFSHINVTQTEKRLFTMAENEASKTSDAIKGSLKDAMMSNNRDVIASVVSTISKEATIEDIKIIDIGGQVKYAKNPIEVGSTLDKTKINSCNLCHKSSQLTRNNLTIIFTNEQGNRVLRNVNPIDNESQCHICHNPSQKILGKLLIDFKIKDVEAVVYNNKILLIISQVITLITALTITIALLFVYLRPKLHNLTQNIRKTTQGNYDTTIDIKGEDEMAVLAYEFNSMVEAIRQRDEKIRKQLKTFTTLHDISSILKRAETLQEAITLILNALNIGLNIEQCTILFIDDVTAKVELKGSIGLDEERADLVRLLIEEMFELSNMSVSKDRDEIREVIEGKEKIVGDEVFVASGDGMLMDDFIVAPLKAGGKVIGAITVHKIISSEITDPEIKDTLSIVATALSPYVYIGMCSDKQAHMQDSPYDAIIGDIQKNIERVEQYQGGLSVIVIKATNYEPLINQIGLKKTLENISRSFVMVSSHLDKVHEIIRISQDTALILLPMITLDEATNMIQAAINKCFDNIQWLTKLISYPEDADTAEGILHLAVRT